MIEKPTDRERLDFMEAYHMRRRENWFRELLWESPVNAKEVAMLAGSWFDRKDLPLVEREAEVEKLVRAYADQQRPADNATAAMPVAFAPTVYMDGEAHIDDDIDEKYSKQVRFNKYHAMTRLLMSLVAQNNSPLAAQARDILAGRVPPVEPKSEQP